MTRGLRNTWLHVANSLAGAPPPPGFEDSLQNVSAQDTSGNSLKGAPPPEGLEDAIYSGAGEQTKAALEGAARAITLGGSDLAETKLLGVDPNDIQGRRETSAANIGSLGGAGALTYLTGGLAAPAEEGLLAVGAGGLASKALAYGAEGAVFGAGNSVSDYALGDPNLNAQKVLSNIGLSALFGAGVGALTHGAQGLIGKSVSDVAREANASSETQEALTSAERSASGTDSISDGGPSLLKGLNPQKENAGEIIKAGDLIGAPVTETMTSGNRWLERADDALINGAPTFQGVARNKLYNEGFSAVKKTLDGVLDTGEKFGGGAMTKNQLGEAMQNSLTTKIAKESEPIEAMYEAMKPHMQAIDLPDKTMTGLAKEILAMPETKTSFAEGTLAKNVARDLVNLETVEDLKNYRSALNRSVAPTASAGEKHMLGVLQDKLQELEENSIVRAAESSGLPAEARREMRGLIDARDEANKAYKPFRQALNSLTEQLGKKNAGGAQTAINFIKDLDPEALANKLFDKKYAGFNKFFADKFPEEAALMRQYQKQALKDAASKTGEFSPKTFFNNLNKLEPEVRSQIFFKDELEKIKAAETYTRALPKNFNPSGTDHTGAFRAFFENPTGAAIANARDFGIRAFMKAIASLPEAERPNPYELGHEMAEKFNKLSALDKMAVDQDKKISESVKHIFQTKNAIKGAANAGASLTAHSTYNKVSGDVKNLVDNPSGIVDHLAHHTGDLHQTAPNVTQALHNTSLAALSFLNSKLPRPPSKLPLSATYEPSPAEKSKFMRYFNAVDNPVSVLQEVRHGTLSNEAMEALQAVHPQLLQQMQRSIAAELGTSKNLAYSVKMSVAKFIGKPLDSSMLPKVIVSNQMALSNSGQQQQSQQQAQPSGRRSGSLKSLNMSQRAKTQTEDDELDTK